MQDRERLEKESHRGRDYPIAMEPIYAVEDPYLVKPYGAQSMYGYPGPMAHPRAYPGPYMAPDTPRYAVGYGDPQRDMWAMREVSS